MVTPPSVKQVVVVVDRVDVDVVVVVIVATAAVVGDDAAEAFERGEVVDRAHDNSIDTMMSLLSCYLRRSTIIIIHHHLITGMGFVW